MVESFNNSQTKEPVTLLPFLASVLMHGVVVLAILFLSNNKPLPEITTVETELVSGDDLASLQAQIASAYAAKQAAQSQSNDEINNTQTVPDKTDFDSSYNDELAQKERDYQAQMQAYAQSLDQEILSEIQSHQDQLQEEDKERQRQVNELQNKERSNDDIAQENLKTLNKTRETIEKSVNEAKKASQATSHQSLGENNTPNHAPTVGRGGKIGSSSSGSNQATANIASRVQAIWERYDNPPNRRLSATITIDDDGNLQNIRFGAGDKDLEPSLQTSIKEAAPFPEMAGIANSFTINFSTK